jgi:hypothetical protein
VGGCWSTLVADSPVGGALGPDSTLAGRPGGEDEASGAGVVAALEIAGKGEPEGADPGGAATGRRAHAARESPSPTLTAAPDQNVE